MAAFPPSEPRSIQSVVIGFALIRALEQDGARLPLKTLAAEAEMSPGQAHAYLVSFRAVGLVQQGEDGLYELGPYALALGLAALERLDVREAAKLPMRGFRNETGESVHLSVWSGQGPVIVSRVDGTHGVSLSIRIGFALPLDGSASGRIFAAFLPELQSPKPARRGRTPTATLDQVRATRLAVSESLVNSGFAAISMPVFDFDHNLVAAMTALGPAAHLDTRADGAVATALRAAVDATSSAMGCVPR